MNIGSLFSGIGGLELGLEWAGFGPVIWQAEKNPYCLKILEKHWPDVKRYTDVKQIDKNAETVDLICGGFPCQDISIAGKGAGLSGARSGLWYAFLRVIKELRPWWVIIENVASGATRWVDQVRGQLEREDYATFPVPLSAQDVGAPHLRKRVFVIAHTDMSRPEGKMGNPGEECPGRPIPDDGNWWSVEPPVDRMVHGVPNGMDRIRCLGNAVVPQCTQIIGEIIIKILDA